MGVKRSHRDSLPSSEDPSSPFPREASADIKLVQLDSHSAVCEQPAVMKCLLPPHEPLAFASIDEYDVHYRKTHMNRCSECQRNFPDEHILHLHIAENHDPFNAARRERGEQTVGTRLCIVPSPAQGGAKRHTYAEEMCPDCTRTLIGRVVLLTEVQYACLVPTCDRLCSTAPKRRMHCIDKHQFPRDYDFFIINDGIDRRNTMLRPTRRRRSSTINSTSSHHGRTKGDSSASAAGDGMDVVQDGSEHETQTSSHAGLKLRGRGGFTHPQATGRGSGRHDGAAPSSTTTNADPLDKLVSDMSALHFVPHSVRMARGRGRGRGG